MPVHTVRQGEHISRLAKENGLASYLTIWNHPENCELKAKRKNPNVLYPGDEIFIPDMDPSPRDANTDKTHSYQLNGKPLHLRIIVQDQTGKPLPNQQALLLIDGKFKTVQSGGDGLIDEPIPATIEQATLTFQGQEPAFQEPVELRVGYLDPIDTESGWVARLNNLGYRAGSVDAAEDGQEDPEAQKMRQSAVEEFQCDNNLDVDGICGPNTQAKLKEIYGC